MKGGKERNGGNVVKRTICLYGAGVRCSVLYRLIKDDYVNVIILDSNSDKWGREFEAGIYISSPDIIYKLEDFVIVITTINSKNYEEIYEKLIVEYHIEKNAIQVYEKICWEAMKKKQVNIKPRTLNIGENLKDKTIILDAYCCQNLGGIEEWLVDLGEALIRRHYKVRILTDDDRAIVRPQNREYADTVSRIGEDYAPEDMLNYISVKKYLISKLPCTIIVNRGNVVAMAACDIKKEYGDAIRIVSVIHNGHNSQYEKQVLYEKYIDMYVGVAKNMIGEMKKRGIRAEKICSTTLPFECDLVLKREYTLDKLKPLQIGYAGRLDKIRCGQKRMDLLLEVIKQLQKKDINVHMTFAGDGPARQELEDAVKQEGMGSLITFLGKINRKEIPEFWKTMDVGINMADYEGRCISMLEMMSNGAVPIFTDVSGVDDDIVNEKNGYVIPRENVNSAVEIITELEKSREKLAILGCEAHNTVLPKSDRELSYNFWQSIIDNR